MENENRVLECKEIERTRQTTIEDEIRSTRSWNEVKGIAGDCNAWKCFTDALCSVPQGVEGFDDDDDDDDDDELVIIKMTFRHCTMRGRYRKFVMSGNTAKNSMSQLT